MGAFAEHGANDDIDLFAREALTLRPLTRPRSFTRAIKLLVNEARIIDERNRFY